MAEPLSADDTIRARVRERYAELARVASAGDTACCAPAAGSSACAASSGSGADVTDPFGAALYPASDRDTLPDTAGLASLGCGNPTAVADLHAGETVLDLGSGGGIDVLLSAQRVGPTGRAYGLDMTAEMLELARDNQRQAGIENVEWLRGTIEAIPLPDAAVDVVISNCVINLSADKPRVLAEAARVLRPGGRFAVTDVVADADMDEMTRRDVAQWTGCVAGALTENEYRRELEAVGFEDVEIRETHRVHEQAGSAIIRARLPA
jgi:arsenite methyltransferase